MALPSLTCKEIVEIVTDYFEGALAPSDRIQFEQHLVLCPECDSYLEQMRKTIRLTGRLREEHIPQDARDELLKAFRGWKGGAA